MILLCGGDKSTQARDIARAREPANSRGRFEDIGMATPSTPARPFDVAHHIRSPEDAAAYLSAALEENDPAAFRRALADVARAQSISAAVGASALGRESLDKALSRSGDPSLNTVQRVMSALGLALTVVPAKNGVTDHA